MHAAVGEVAAEPGAVNTSALDPDHDDRAMRVDPGTQISIAGTCGREAGVPQLSADAVDQRCDVDIGVGVHTRCNGVVDNGWLCDDAHVVPFVRNRMRTARTSPNGRTRQ